MNLIYLDNNATTRIDPSVFAAMEPYFCDLYGNASSHSHVMGWQAESAVSQAILKIAKMINAEPNEIIITSGSSESNNMVLKGLGLSCKDHIVVSCIEHKCILNTALFLASNNRVGLDIIPCDRKGLVSPLGVESAIKPNTKLASIMLGNNEIHSINDIHQISKVCQKNNVLLHVDATQAIGKINVDVKQLNVDFLSFSSHKFYGPKGIGALFIKGGAKDSQLTPLIHGGSQQGNLRGGTMAVPLIVGMGAASEITSSFIQNKGENRIIQLTKLFYSNLRNEINEVQLNGPDFDDRLPGGLSITIPQIDMGKVQFACPNICFSRGAACSSGDLDYSYVLKSLGLTASDAAGTARFCIGRFNSLDDIYFASQSIINAVKKQYKK